jgi:hypothetical protein
MKLEQAHIDQIRISFEKMQSREDLLHVLNEAKPLVYGDKAVPFDLKQLTLYANPKLGRNRYAEFKIKKKSGAERCIHAPVKGLKSLQKTLSFVLQCVYEPHNAAMGFVRDRSIVDNAKLHVGSRYVYNIDLIDFFPSVDQARVWKCLQLKPFNLNKVSSVEPQYMKWDDFKKEYLNTQDPIQFFIGKGRMFTNTPYGKIFVANNFDKEKEKYILLGSSSLKTKTGKSLEGTLWLVNKIPDTSRLDIANIIASLCCAEMEVERKNETGEWEKVKRNVLPQGAPTSPVITNIVCQRLDYLLTGVAKRFGLKYSRYADDITFSSMHNVFQPESEFLTELHRIIAEQNFHIKESKTRLQKDGYRKEVTGLLVNEKANVQQRYIKQLRMWLYYWERYGYERASGFFSQQYIADKGHVKNGKPDMANVIGGKLDYLKMVKGSENELYLKLKSRFDKLSGIYKDEVIKTPSFSLIKNISIVDFENRNTKKEEVRQHDTNRLRININTIDSAKGPIKLKRQIIIRKGESLPHEELLENNEDEKKEIDLSKHKPIDVTRFLLNFRSSDGLKFLTHDFDKSDSVFDYNSILAIAKKEFNDLSSQFVIPPSLWARINQFAFGDTNNVWRFNRVSYKLNWQSPELLSWMEANPITHPINNEVFEKGFIIPFKKSIEIKSPDLEYIFKNKLAENLASKYLSFDIELIDLDKANFYTNVDALQVGISYILKSINQRFKNSNKIRVEFSRKADEEGRKRIIKIIHLGSNCDKPLDKNDLFQGDLLEAEKALFGICDWSIISKSTDDSVNKLNVLFDINSNKIPREKIEDSLIEGFTHVLTFYA